ncbi:MAG: response regulator [Nitrospirae bacterium]|nr:response regulator [Nitrospirota bacterium]
MGQGHETILVIDDDEDVLGLIEKHLSNKGFEIVTAYDGEQGLALAEKALFDLVITDLKMPKIDGMEVLRRIKEKTPDTEVVILTGHGTMDSAIEALRDGGAFDYLQKPLYNIKQLSFVTRKALERKRLRLENLKLIETLSDNNKKLEDKLARVVKDLQAIVKMTASSSDSELKKTLTPSLEAIIEILKNK